MECYTKSTCLGYIICKIEDYFGVTEMYFSGKSQCKHVFFFFFWKILKMGNLERLMCAYCSLKDDMPFVSDSYMIEVNNYIENSDLCFSKS